MSERPCICLIDDDALVRDSLCLVLEDAGYEVRAAADGRAGLALLADGGVAAVVTDMTMPGFAGADFIAAVRTRLADVPIIAISGAVEIEGRAVTELARQAGADLVMVKPFRGREIAAAIEKLRAARG